MLKITKYREMYSDGPLPLQEYMEYWLGYWTSNENWSIVIIYVLYQSA